MRCGTTILMLAACLAPVHALRGEPASPEPKAEGVQPLLTLKADTGYLDDAFALDSAGGRVVVIDADNGHHQEIHVADLAMGGRVTVRVDISALTLTPLEVKLVGDGAHLFVRGRDADGRIGAAVLDLTGKVERRWGPATGVALAERAGVPVVSVLDVRPGAKGGTTYKVGVHQLLTGKTLAERELLADPDGLIPALKLSILYWKDGYTQIVGRKKGGYDRAKDRRMNDSQGTYDVVAGTIVKDLVVEDLIAWAKVLKVRGERDSQETFVRVTEDLARLEVVLPDDRRVAVELAGEPLARYDLSSLRQELSRDGKLYFSLTVDPLNAEAVERKRQDPELIDLFVCDPTAPAADVVRTQRLARLPRAGRPFVWHVTSGRLAVLRKHKAMGRGGPELELYDLVRP